jgi:CDP-glycerol glycerophosphotransferase (TagB/SpsB family)
MNIVSKIGKGLGIAGKMSLGLFSRGFPRNDDLWIFGTSGKNVFWENPKYFFLYVSNKKSDSGVRPVWISKSRDMVEELRDEGYEAFYYRSLKGLWLSLRAGKVFFSHNVEDINAGLPLGAEKVDFFHGAPLKRFGWDNSSQIGGNGLVTVLKALYKVLYFDFDIGISSSEYMENIYRSATVVQYGRFESTGFPRNDLFFRDVEDWEIGADKEAVERMSSSDRKNVMYLPTWRSYDEYSFEDIMDLERMSEWAESNDANVIFKLHPSSNIDEEAVEDFDNLWLMQQSVDLQPLLKETDILISDYSSVHNDFLLLDRPIVFYPFDRDRYKENRGFVRDYDNFTPGPKAFSFDELIESLDEVIEEDNYEEDRKEVREKLFDDLDGGSSERVWDMLMDD